MKLMVQWGAGSIGRSFLGQIFASNGYRVVFIDINKDLVDLLHKNNSYNVILRENEGETCLPVMGIDAIDGHDEEAVIKLICEADYLSTSLGSGVLPHVMPLLVKGLQVRQKETPGRAVDIIIAENLADGAAFFRKHMALHDPQNICAPTGLVECSIGKMVPLDNGTLPPGDVAAEAYDQLIMDRKGFLTSLPELRQMKAVSPIEAYVKRKLFIHNLGHAAAAYLGYRKDKSFRYIWQSMESDEIQGMVRKVMIQTSGALFAEFPDVFSRTDLIEHIDDLLKRFGNRALGDTIYRVGRDIPRKYGASERICGAIALCMKHRLPFDAVAEVYIAGLENSDFFD